MDPINSNPQSEPFSQVDTDLQFCNKAYQLSLANLLKNSTEFGLLAAGRNTMESQIKHYTYLYPRDIGVSALGIFSSGNPELLEVLKTSLIYLTKSQSQLGQFPFYFHPQNNTTRWWTPNSIDSTLWWSITFLLYYQQTKDEMFFNSYKSNLEKAYLWLLYQDTNNDSLLEQGEASDWADEMPRSGTVLYTNALWFWLVRLRIEIEGKDELKPLKENIYEGVNTLLWVKKESSTNFNYIPENSFTTQNPARKSEMELINSQLVYLPYYLGCVGHRSFESRCDTFGNILACLVGLADDFKASSITDFIVRSGVNLPFPIKALYPPIYPGERDWKDFMVKNRQNYPWQYHNGGIWPFVGGFWITWLAQYSQSLAKSELLKLAVANSLNDWEFNEYLHGQHGTPMGVPFQSWNMGMFLAAYDSIYKNKNVFGNLSEPKLDKIG